RQRSSSSAESSTSAHRPVLRSGPAPQSGPLGWMSNLASRSASASLQGSGPNTLRLPVPDLRWRWLEATSLQLAFTLPPGSYATAVLHELGECADGAADASHRNAGPAASGDS
ncbi:MAG TPA: hypothetical protein VK325_03395, partial [Pseudoxanthomonas sp.]|nr:hypothetical protein [Pseudoxanthomonas sp.]